MTGPCLCGDPACWQCGDGSSGDDDCDPYPAGYAAALAKAVAVARHSYAAASNRRTARILAALRAEAAGLE